MELPRNIRTLTGVRGYAALWVLFFHLRANPHFLSFWTPGAFIRHGFWGVDVFFVLSGFVLSHVYESKFSKGVMPKAYFHFLGLRLARMYPLHIVTFVAALAFAILSHAIGHGAATDISLYGALMHLMLLHAWGTTSESFNLVSWAISAEWFAYLFLLVPCIRVLRTAPLKLLFAITGILWCLLIFVYVPTTPSKLVNMTYEFGILRILPEFLGGYVAYRTVKAMRCNTRLCDLASLTGLAGIVVITHHNAFQVLLLPAIMLFIIGLSAEGSVTSRFLDNRMSLFLGKLSYSIYMCHFILLWVVDGIFKRTDLPHTPWAGIGVMAIYFIAMFLTSYVLYAFIEQPCREWLRKRLNALFTDSANTRRLPAQVALDPGNSIQKTGT